VKPSTIGAAALVFVAASFMSGVLLWRLAPQWDLATLAMAAAGFGAIVLFLWLCQQAFGSGLR
jgi:hypothetical protein